MFHFFKEYWSYILVLGLGLGIYFILRFFVNRMLAPVKTNLEREIAVLSELQICKMEVADIARRTGMLESTARTIVCELEKDGSLELHQFPGIFGTVRWECTLTDKGRKDLIVLQAEPPSLLQIL